MINRGALSTEDFSQQAEAAALASGARRPHPRKQPAKAQGGGGRQHGVVSGSSELKWHALALVQLDV
jgi:hypothetical protein